MQDLLAKRGFAKSELAEPEVYALELEVRECHFTRVRFVVRKATLIAEILRRPRSDRAGEGECDAQEDEFVLKWKDRRRRFLTLTWRKSG